MLTTEVVSPVSALVNLLADELRRRWRAGERPVVEEYLALYPELEQSPGGMVELIYEELCLRREAGEEGSATEVLARFPQLQEQLQVLGELHRFLESESLPRPMPEVGQRLGDFHLLAELGQGAQGKVFLAKQSTLGGRLMVLKLGPRSGHEHLSLARLQHTHIMPLYSVVDSRELDLRILCMPYFGGGTLFQILHTLKDVPPAERTGQDIVEAIERAHRRSAAPMPSGGPACKFLSQVSYVRAVCWMGICLADALHYTHARGLVHLDLKPPNILCTADGQPMILDLHLAQAPISAGQAAPSWLGGTPPYMAPEQQMAVQAVPDGGLVPVAVDGRADTYALGVVLAEALAGERPPPGRSVSDWLRHRNPRVPACLAELLGQCLADDPTDRPADAAMVADALRGRLAVPARRGWRYRHGPHLAVVTLMVLMAAGALMGYLAHETTRVRAALEQATVFLGHHQIDAARTVLDRANVFAQRLPFQHHLSAQLSDLMKLLQRAEAANELHEVVERMRPLYGAHGQSPTKLEAVQDRCSSLWRQREQITRKLLAPGSSDHEQVRNDLFDIAILWTDIHVRLAREKDMALAHQDALRVLSQAERLLGPSCVVDAERQTHRKALGLPTLPSEPGALVARTAWEHYALGRLLLRTGDVEGAAVHLNYAVNRMN